MHAIIILREEHRTLHRILRSLEAMADAIVRTGWFDEEAALEALELLERFADGSHQAKEEELMRLAARRASERHRARPGTLERLARLHTEERNLLRGLHRQLGLAMGGDSWAFDLFVAQAREYAKLQRAHAAMEERELFPVLEELLAGADERELTVSFARIDADYLGASAPTPAQLAERLSRRVEPLDT